MSQADPDTAKEPAKEPTTAKVKRRGRLSPVWLIPVVAAALVAYLAWTSIANQGKEVTLVLGTADGLTPDQTTVKHKAVTVGTVKSVHLAKDMKSVVATIRMEAGTEGMLTDHARFWVVRPRLNAGGFTGLETLVSGAYIEVDPGDPGGRKQTEFKALAEPPGRQSDEPGQTFLLGAKRLGALTSGSPVYYRDVEVGEVLSYDLGSDVGPLTLKVFVRAPYDKLVHLHSRFWNASGLSVTSGPAGMRVEVESIQTLLSGGIAFETPPDDDGAVAPESTRFRLYGDKAAADDDFYRDNIPYVTYFQTSVEGLTKGSPVQIAGVQVGTVTDVRLVTRPGEHGMSARVTFGLQPERVLAKGAASDASASQDVRKAFTDRAMRVTLASSNLLTGAKDLTIEYTADRPAGERPAGEPAREGDAIVLPSHGAGIDSMTASLASVAERLDKIPFERIGEHADQVLASLQHIAAHVDADAVPALAQLPGIATQLSLVAQNASGTLGAGGYGPNSDFQHDIERMMREVNDAARSVRALTEYLDRHPEALLRGRAERQGR